MDTQSEIRVLTPDERAELKRLAEGATPGPWVVVPAIGSPPNADGSWPNTDRAKWSQHCGVEQGDEHGRDASSIFYADSKHVGAILQDADYIAAVSPDLTLGTLAYVEQLEAKVRDLQADQMKQFEGGLSMKQFILTQGEELNDTNKALDAATARATKAESRAEGLQAELAEQEREKFELIQQLARKERVLMLYHRKMFAMLNIGSMGFADFEAGWGGVVDLMDAKGKAERQVAEDFQREVDAARPSDELLQAEIEKIDAPTQAPAPAWVHTPCTCGFLAQTVGDGCHKCNPECFEDEEDGAAAAPQGEETPREEVAGE